MTYYLVMASLLFSRMLQSGRTTKGLYWPVLIGLYIFSAFRFQVGCDWFNYQGNFLTQRDLTYSDAMAQTNPAHWMLLETIDTLGLSYHWLNVATSTIFFAGLHAVARRSPAPLAVLVLAFPVLILNMPMSAVKQAAAIGLICFAFNAFTDRKPILFVGWVALASLFHGSALVFLLLLPFVLGNYSKRNILLAGALAVPGALALLATEAAELANTRYIEGDADAGGAIFRVGLLVATGLFYTVVLSPRWKVAMPQSHKLISLLALGMIGLAMLLPLSTVIADRFGYYFNIPQILIYAAIPQLYGRGRNSLLVAAPYVALIVLFLAWTQLSGHFRWCYLPYGII